MADITVKAAYGSVVEDEGFLFIGFAEGEEEEDAAHGGAKIGGGSPWIHQGSGDDHTMIGILPGQPCSYRGQRHR